MVRVDNEISGSAKCPCGQGTIEYHYLDYDGPYAKPVRTLEWNCSTCAGRALDNIGNDFEPRITVDGEIFIERMEIKILR